ncbi:MAG TPA: hypothetical protein VHS55_09560, partial [Solirubrobacteraceae bacterium]|nr:hypothetical protein [Solirubrobacteraceae bacterium]
MLDIIEVDAHIAPEEQAAALGDHAAYANRCSKRGAQHRAVIHLDDPILTLALLGLVGALELDEVRMTGTLFAELETTADDLEVGIALPDVAVVLCAESPAHLKRAVWVWIAGLQLDVPSWLLHGRDCDGR